MPVLVMDGPPEIVKPPLLTIVSPISRNHLVLIDVVVKIVFNYAISSYRSCCVGTVCEVQTFIQCNCLSILPIRFVCQRNLSSCFVTIECYCISCVMVCFILYRCNSDRVVSCVCSIYSYCFTSCIFYVVTGYVYFVSCTSFTDWSPALGDTFSKYFCR